MNSTRGLNIDIITNYIGASNMKKAEKDILGLGAAAKSLVGSFAIEQLIQRSFAAFKAENTAVVTLTNSLKNLGISYDALQPVIEKQNQTFENLGFSAAQTIGAYTKLTTALGNPAKAMDVMSTAADLARYKQTSLEDTAAKMAKAIAGNSRAFADLGLKIDKSLTPQNAFNKLMDQAKAKVAGLATAYSKTAAGAMDIFSAKTENASAKLGESLAPELQKLAQFATTYLIPVFGLLADNIGPITAVATAIGLVTLAMKGLGIATAIATGEMVLNPIFAGAAAIALIASKLTQKTPLNDANNNHLIMGGKGAVGFVRDPNNLGKPFVPQKIADVKKLTAAETLLANLEKQWNASALKAAQAQTQAEKDKLKAKRDALSLSLAGSTADMQNIEIQAALQRGQTEQVNNVLLLQRALITGNADEANILAQKVLTANGLVMDVNGNITALAGAKDPFKDWPTAAQSAIDQLKKVNDYLATIKDKTITITVNTVTTSTGSTTSIGGGGAKGGTPGPSNPIDPQSPTPVIIIPPSSNIPNGGSDLGAGNSGGFSSVVAKAMGYTDANPTDAASLTEYNKEKYGNAGAAPIVINISAPPSTTVTTTQDASTNGTPVTVNRNNPFGMYSV
jgi:hypothetical protein